MGEKRSDGVRRRGTWRQGGAGRARGFLAGLAIVVALVVAVPDRSGTPAVDPAGTFASGLAPAGGLNFPVLETVRESESGRGFAFPATRAVGGIVLVAATPEQDEKLEEWRAEGIRMAAELTGIPEAFFRWLQDKGVPVGEFMRFLMPFLQWIEMVDPHNGTRPAPKSPPAGQPRQTAA